MLGAISNYAKSSKAKSLKSAFSQKSVKSAKSSVGSEYRSKKAKGDVKSKGQKYDPYAYIPMNRMTLNKRSVSNILRLIMMKLEIVIIIDLQKTSEDVWTVCEHRQGCGQRSTKRQETKGKAHWLEIRKVHLCFILLCSELL